MLIKAMITRIERENMIELSGIGVPMVVTWNICQYRVVLMVSLQKQTLRNHEEKGNA